MTPFHFGPGAAVKAAIPRHFSLMVFCFSQCLVDVEAVYFILRGELPYHRWFHTYVGAAPLALTSVLIGRPLCSAVIRLWLSWPDPPYQRYFPRPASHYIPLSAALSGAVIGTYSHVLLDSFMHVDMLPLRPFSTANALYGKVGLVPLHLFCAATGLIAICWLARRPRKA